MDRKPASPCKSPARPAAGQAFCAAAAPLLAATLAFCMLAGPAGAAESTQPMEVAMVAPAAAPAPTAFRQAPVAGRAAYRLPAESPRIHRPLELKLAPAPVRLTKPLQNGPAPKRPPGTESQNALKGHGTADFADADIEYKWQIKGSKLKVMIPF